MHYRCFICPGPGVSGPNHDARRAGRPGDAGPCCPLTRRGGGRRNCRPSRPHAIRTGPTRGPLQKPLPGIRCHDAADRRGRRRLGPAPRHRQRRTPCPHLQASNSIPSPARKQNVSGTRSPPPGTDTSWIYERITLSSQHALQQVPPTTNIRATDPGRQTSGNTSKLAVEFSTNLFSNCQRYSPTTEYLLNSGTYATNWVAAKRGHVDRELHC
jgi:hypothetical protein